MMLGGENLMYELTQTHKEMVEELKDNCKIEQNKLYEIYSRFIDILNMIIPQNFESIRFFNFIISFRDKCRFDTRKSLIRNIIN